MTEVIIFLTICLALLIVCVWDLKRELKEKDKLLADAEELIDRLLRERVLREQELAEKGQQLAAARAGMAYVEKFVEEWPEVLDR